ncbi:YhcN/YlaJ family sporulation lipoprotein [Virgibacillus proomii]|uniref:YhcN/YlaJ family sporulation lipoprotein n=1 Tax=Virgibacillus proomii TaxID=84407 RepID=UPI000985F34C|nr:YhcN/YlaJ family sporulation lipoprotein [Virgibacillus proomii]
MELKKLLPIGLTTLFLMTGCMDNDTATDEREEIKNQLDPNGQLQAPADESAENKLGYVRYTKDEIDNDNENNRSISIDRTEMANMITRIMLRGNSFEEVATLVTDNEVLIAYEKSADTNSERATEIAKKTATSIMPGYFDVYVTDNTNLIDDIQSLHNSRTTDGNYDNTIDNIIKEMNKTTKNTNE